MKLCRYEWNGRRSLGIVDGEEITPLAGDMEDLGLVIAAWQADPAALAEVAQDSGPSVPLVQAKLLAPLARPQKIVAIGSNYPRPGGAAAVEGAPVLFFKPPSAVCGPHDPILLPPEAELVIGEVELAVVIGRAGERIAPDDAASHIFGYMVANDVTAPRILLGESAQNPLYLQQSRGKGFKSFCPIGPWIVTADELPFPPALGLEQHVDDFLEIAGHTSAMSVSLLELIADVSCAFGLEAGDILLTGSPPPLAGKRTALTPGSVLRSAISGIGELANPVRRL